MLGGVGGKDERVKGETAALPPDFERAETGGVPDLPGAPGEGTAGAAPARVAAARSSGVYRRTMDRLPGGMAGEREVPGAGPS